MFIFSILNELNTNIESLLYYKYLQAKYPIDKESNLEPLRIEGKGRILYIDDEWNGFGRRIIANGDYYIG